MFDPRLVPAGRLVLHPDTVHSHLASIVESANDAIISFAPDGSITTWNEGAARMYGYTRDEVLGRDIGMLIAPLDSAEAEQIGQWQVMPEWIDHTEAMHIDRDGRRLTVSVVLSPVRDGSGAIVATSMIVRDRSARRLLEEQLRRQAFHDGLTGLPNRFLFTERLSHALALAVRRSGGVGVLFLDLDGFKDVNDRLGHGAGDSLLAALGQRLATCIRAGDTVARLGGDEFVVLLEDLAHPSEALAVAERLLVAVRQPLILHGHEVAVTTSMGIATAIPVTARLQPDELVKQADIALLSAKAAGKACAVEYSSASSCA